MIEQRIEPIETRLAALSQQISEPQVMDGDDPELGELLESGSRRLEEPDQAIRLEVAA